MKAGQDHLGDDDEDVLSSRIGAEIGGQHGAADEADAQGAHHGDDDPHHGDNARLTNLFSRADAQEANEHLRHAEVAKAPSQGGDDGEDSEIGRLTEQRLIALDRLQTRIRIHNGRGELTAVQETGNVLQESHRHIDAANGGDGAMSTTARAKNIKQPWMKSVATTERYPPTSVYANTTTAPKIIMAA